MGVRVAEANATVPRPPWYPLCTAVLALVEALGNAEEKSVPDKWSMVQHVQRTVHGVLVHTEADVVHQTLPVLLKAAGARGAIDNGAVVLPRDLAVECLA